MKIALCAVSLLFLLSLNSCSHLKQKKETPEEKIPLAEVIAKNGYATTVYFDVSSYSLNFKMEDILKRLARLQHLSKTEVHLHGHADITGKQELNLILSENRVESVKKYLMKLGIKDEIIHTSYYGDQAPAVFGETPDVFAKNRRVEIELRPVKTPVVAEEVKDASVIIEKNNEMPENDEKKDLSPSKQKMPAEINENKEAGDTEQALSNDLSAEEQPVVDGADKNVEEKTEEALLPQQATVEQPEENNSNNINSTSNEINTESK